MKTPRPKQRRFKAEKRRVLIVTGTPGAGKSTVSKELASKIGARLVSVGRLVETEGLHIGRDRKRNSLIADMEKVSEKIKEILAESSGDVVIEGHYAVDVVVPEKVKFVFVLRRDPVELRKVLTERGYREEKIRENLAAEILDVCLYDAVNRCGRDKVCEVDVTGKKVDDVMKEIFQILDGKKPCSIGIVDWLSRLESAGKLDEYLAEF
ncbi:hypothetical protein CW712_05575 [Candidatus Bathyarchaeota archaeon]|nr:MAG: hypothetical protein CW712_05575 [Candidatus Bathyarchaeota archaeon]